MDNNWTREAGMQFGAQPHFVVAVANCLLHLNMQVSQVMSLIVTRLTTGRGDWWCTRPLFRDTGQDARGRIKILSG